MEKDVLQKMIDSNGRYLIANRRGSDGDQQAIFIGPNVSREYWVDDIGKLPYDDVQRFAKEELMTIIHLGSEYGPFQYGIYRDQITQVTEVTCESMKLIVHCYQNKIRDYYKVLEAMKLLTEEEKQEKQAV